MAKWAFVQAVNLERDNTNPLLDDVLVSFRHTIVDAVDEAGAYRAGHKWSNAQNPAGIALLNDYVFVI